ncbi:MAG: TonB family protein [Gammaproteobacteria bacterium]|nr:TonB family protein [Gammaproteobacteria bacterium]
MQTLLRILASFVMASVFVVTLVGLGVNYFDRDDDNPPVLDFVEVDNIDLAERPDLADAIQRERDKYREPQEETAPPLPPPRPEREIAGFVQLEFTINADGSVSDVEVIGATPAGIYEEQAMRQVGGSLRAPVFENGEAVARRVTEIVEFTVPASALRGDNDAGN